MRSLRLPAIALIATLALVGTAAAVGASLHAQHATTTDKAALAGDHTFGLDPSKGASLGTSLTTDHASVKGAGDAQVTGVPDAPNVHQMPDVSNLSAPKVGGSGDAAGSGSATTDAGHADGSGAGGIKVG